MGVDVALMQVAQRGSSSRHRRLSVLAVVADDADLLARAFTRSRTPMLSRIGPNRDLILTPAEMEQFTAEVEILIPTTDENCAVRLRQVLELARQCRATPATELHFQGD